MGGGLGDLGKNLPVKMEASFVQTGGVRIGEGLLAFNASWPFAKLEVGDENLTLTCLWKKWTFAKRSIRRLSEHQGIVSSGLRIEHDVADYSTFFVFWSCGIAKLKCELEKRGSVVS